MPGSPPHRNFEYLTKTNRSVFISGAAKFIEFHTAAVLLKRGEHVVGLDNLNAYYDIELKKARSAELTRHAVPSVLAGTAVLENIPSNFGQAKRVIKLSIGEKPTVGSDLGTVKFQLQAAVKINSQRELSAFTRRVTWGVSVSMCIMH